jgi:hypothetical protein
MACMVLAVALKLERSRLVKLVQPQNMAYIERALEAVKLETSRLVKLLQL